MNGTPGTREGHCLLGGTVISRMHHRDSFHFRVLVGTSTKTFVTECLIPACPASFSPNAQLGKSLLKAELCLGLQLL